LPVWTDLVYIRRHDKENNAMNFPDYYHGLNLHERAQYAATVGTSTAVIERKYISADHVPRRERMKMMIDATGGRVTWREMLDHFYPEGAAA